MSTNDPYRNYSAGDIQKYLAGELSAPEMHALESAALEDPFLADALEGIETNRGLRGEDAIPSDLAELTNRLRDRVAGKKGRVLPLYRTWWRVAAAVVLLTGLAIFSSRYFFNGQRPSAVLAKTEKQTAPTDSIAINTPPVASTPHVTNTPPMASSLPAAAPELTDTEKRAKKMSASMRNDAVIERRLIKERSAEYEDKKTADIRDQADRNQTVRDETVLDNAEISRKKLIQAYYFGKSRVDTMHLAFTPTRLYAFDTLHPAQTSLYKSLSPGFGTDLGVDANRYFIGKVIDSNNNPIPYATISFFNKQQAARTDNNGLFQFQLLGSLDSLAPVVITSDGYYPASLTLNALTRDNDALSNIIRMQPENKELNGVVTVGYGSQKRKASRPTAINDFSRTTNNQSAGNRANANGVPGNIAPGNTAPGNGIAANENLIQRAAPVIGWAAYQRYLKKYKPTNSFDSTLKGNEIISFQVDRKGKLSAFTIEQSLSPAHDSLLIRLIRRGPVWKPLEGKKAGAIVIMAF
jgi:hypothetical protein